MLTSENNFLTPKIVDCIFLRRKFKEFPRTEKIVLCHGVFDVVHPGHIRHLLYAKSLGDVLVVSITADKYVNKGENRPHIPEQLRAISLASMMIVDYVIINNSPTVLNILEDLEPDVFAKGFEYSSNSMPKPTQAELNVVRNYGGKMLFTPGDIVYSSTKILSLQKPSIKYELLSQLMDRFGITKANIFDTLAKLPSLSVLVVGDTIVDEIVNVNVIGGPTKTPNLSVRKLDSHFYLGGAAIVASHLAQIGANVQFCTLISDDFAGIFAKNKLRDQEIEVHLVTDSGRPTTTKSVISCDSQRLIKIDSVDNRPIEDSQVSKISKVIEEFTGDLVIFSDFRHGIFNAQTIGLFTSKVKKNIFKVADSQLASRWGNITDFKEMDLVTPNEKEARFSIGDQDSSLGSLIGRLALECRARNVILKLGSRGTLNMFVEEGVPLHDAQSYSIESFVDNLIDPVGAGDALLAYAALTLVQSNSLPMASIIGSVAAACACEQEGNQPISREKVVTKFHEIFHSMSYETLS